jgi:hypothetical protein
MDQQQMEAELIFDHPEARDRAVAELIKQGYAIELLDWTDDYETVWIKVRGLYAGSDDEFLAEMGHLANQFSGDVIEAGLQFPPERKPENSAGGDTDDITF